MPDFPAFADERFDRRQRRLLMVAWASTLFPLAIFAYVTWQLIEAQQNLQSVRAELATMEARRSDLEAEIRQKETELAHKQEALQEQREISKHYRDFAGIRIQFYRESDRQMVEGALEAKGFKVDTTLGESQLIDQRPNTIAYGESVSELDLRDIAVALVENGFPLKSISKATRQRDPNLIQIIASVRADESCGILTVERIRAGETCGPLRGADDADRRSAP